MRRFVFAFLLTWPALCTNAMTMRLQFFLPNFLGVRMLGPPLCGFHPSKVGVVAVRANRCFLLPLGTLGHVQGTVHCTPFLLLNNGSRPMICWTCLLRHITGFMALAICDQSVFSGPPLSPSPYHRLHGSGNLWSKHFLRAALISFSISSIPMCLLENRTRWC